MAGLTHHFLLNPLVGQPFLGSEGEDGHDKIKAKRYGSGSGWSALYDLLESILAPRSNAGCRPSERQKIEAVSDVLITNDNIGEADNDEMAKVAASYWQVISIPAGINRAMTPAKMTVAPSLVALSVAGTANSAATPEENCMTYTEFVAAYCSDSWSEEAAKALQRRRPRLQAIDGGKSD